MNKYVARLCVVALLLSGAIFVMSCGNDNDNDNAASKNGTAPPAASPAGSAPVNMAGLNFGGAIDRVDCDVISGWLWTSAHPDLAIPLELYIDNKLQTKLKADQFRKDLRDAGFGTGNYQFVYQIPVALKDGKPHPIKMKVENSDYELTFYKDNPHSINCKP